MQNGTQTLNKSSTFDHFQYLHKNFQECQNKTKEDLCPTCMNDYVILNNYFTQISNVNEKISYCMDIVDIVGGIY